MNPQIKMLNAAAKQKLPSPEIEIQDKDTGKIIQYYYSKRQMLEMFRIGYDYAKIHG